ncbi:MAG TPA: hemolysin family protein [Candidatus Angelobacter sp.]|nr:hemolysin family protein [Candidatus Angelobacter sp.]
MTLVSLYIAILVLCGLLVLVSYVDRLYTESGKFLSREFQENITAFEKLVEPRLLRASRRAALAIAVLEQLCTAVIALLIGYLVFRDQHWTWPEIAQAVVGIILVVIVCNRLLPYVIFTRTRGEWLVHFIPLLQGLIYLMLPIAVALGFGLSVAALAEPHEPEEPEHPSEAVDALIEAAEEEGILEEGDRQLIQSVVEFGDKTVREVMTPRPNIFAVPATTTIETFTTLLRDKPYSRVPLYSTSIDQIQGMVLAHDLIQIPDALAHTTTVAKLVRPVLFVPETKMTTQLLREMQKDNIHMAIVIDEYGSVAGLVTMEDLVEEIVGEIRDEHEQAQDIVREGDSAYVMQGTVDVGRLQDLFDVRLDGRETATVGGLVSAIAGRIPQPGEVVEEDGLRFEILESTDRKVEKVRVCRADPQKSGSSPKQVQA